jgi:hypothetical protein
MELNTTQIKLSNYTNDMLLEEITRNLSILYGTIAGTQAGDRDFGLDITFLDMPLPTVKALYSAEIIKKTNLYEPRAKVKSVEWDISEDGTLTPKVVIELNE